MRRLGHILLLLVVWLSLACGGKPQAMHSASPYTYYFPVAGFYEPSPLPTPAPTPDPDLACFTDPAAVVFYRLLLTDSRQARAALVCDPRLVAAAKERAVTLAGEGALSHCDARGECVNRVARRYGCTLPAGYAPNGNNIESLAAGTPDPSSCGWPPRPATASTCLRATQAGTSNGSSNSKHRSASPAITRPAVPGATTG